LADQVDSAEFAKELPEKYGMKVAQGVIASAYTANPKLRPLLSRASFRADAVRSNENVRIQRERRNFLRNMLGFVAVSVPALLLLKVAYFSPQAETPTYITNPNAQGVGQVLANASRIPAGESLTLSDPSLGPIILIHLQSGQFVAYSAICTHAGCTVQFNPTAQEIACPCHGAVFDPSNNAQVLAGPAPVPLPSIPIKYDQASGNILLAG
jgi:thiosulfate dehydrogenase [quinone] large subunit